LDPDHLQLNVPPTVILTPGAIVWVDADQGIEIIDRLPDEAVKVKDQAASEIELRDMTEVREGMSLLKRLISSESPLPAQAGVQISVREIRRVSLEQQDPKVLAAAVLKSRPAIAAYRQNRKPMLVHEVFVGRLDFTIWLEPIEGAQFQAVLKGFRIEQSEPGQVTMSSESEVPFAFRASVLSFGPANEDEVSFQPAPTTHSSASPWELAGRPVAAAANGHGRDDGHEVTVLYATCRAVEVAPPTTAGLMSRFVLTANGLFTAAIIVIVLLLGAIGLGLMKRLRWLGLVAGVAIGFALILGIA